MIVFLFIIVSFFKNWSNICSFQCVGMMMICERTLLTSHNRAEIDHIRLVFFQIRVENLKRGLPSFQFFVCFDIIRSEDQSQHRILSQRGPPCYAYIVLICGLDKIIYIWKPGGPLFWFSILIWKNINLHSIMGRQRGSTHIPSSRHL